MTTLQRLSPAERRKRNRDEMAAAIIDVSREVMREGGVAALNLNEVARRLKMKTPSLYKYYAGKTAIYDEVFILAHRTFSEYVSSRTNVEFGSFWELWTVVVECQLEFAYRYPELFELGFQRPVPGFVPSAAGLSASDAIASQGEAVIEAAIESGEINSGLSLPQVRDLLFAVTGGITSAHMANEPGVPPGQGRFGSLARHAVDVFKTAWGQSQGSQATGKLKEV